MSEDLNQVPGEPEEAGQPEQPVPLEQPGQPQAETNLAEEPVREVPPAPAPAVSQQAQPAAPLSESIIPELPVERPVYPPPPEFYAQAPAVEPNRQPAAPAWPVPPGVPVYQPPMPGAPGFPPQPMPGAPIFPPPMQGLPPLPPGYVYMPIQRPAFPYDFPPIPPVEPLPVGQAVRDLPRQYKKILFKPGVRSFLEEQGRAEWGIIWVQLLFQVFLGVLLSIPDIIFANNNSSVAGSSSSLILIETLVAAILGPAFFFAGVGIQYLLARLFKGHGSYKQQAYNQLLYSIPLGVIVSLGTALFTSVTSGSSLMTFYLNPTSSSSTPAPILNGGYLIALLVVYMVLFTIGIYEIVLNVFSIMATHRMTGGKAAGVVLIPYGVLVLLYIVAVFVVFAVVLSTTPAIH